MVLQVKDEQVERRYALTDKIPKITGGFTVACMHDLLVGVSQRVLLCLFLDRFCYDALRL